MKISRTIVIIAAAASAALVLAGCRAEEQGRPLYFKKGAYAGKKDNTLSAVKVKELDDRVMLQGGGTAGPALGARPSGEKPLSGPSNPALSDRLRRQSDK